MRQKSKEEVILIEIVRVIFIVFTSIMLNRWWIYCIAVVLIAMSIDRYREFKHVVQDDHQK